MKPAGEFSPTHEAVRLGTVAKAIKELHNY